MMSNFISLEFVLYDTELLFGLFIVTVYTIIFDSQMGCSCLKIIFSLLELRHFLRYLIQDINCSYN